MKPKIYTASHINKKAIKIINTTFDLNIDKNDCVGMWTHLAPYSGNEFEFIATPCTGIDHLQTDSKIIHLNDKLWLYDNIWATAEHTIALIFALMKNTASKEKKRNELNLELRGRTLGIIGHGRIGRQVAELAYNLGMNVIAKDLKYWWIKTQNQIEHYENLNYLSDKSFFGMCDVITVHVPLNQSTENLITKKEFQQMKYSAYFINTSRSNVVNGQDLYEALCYEKIKGAGIDVIEGYTDALKKVLYAIRDSSFIITPHTAGFTEESREKTDIWLAKQIIDYWENKRG